MRRSGGRWSTGERAAAGGRIQVAADPFGAAAGLDRLRPGASAVRAWVMAVMMAACFAGLPARAEKTNFFLPKNPVAAAYVLGRLSNQELIDAPRGEFVDTALLERKGLDRKYRIEALNGLAEIRHTDRLTELVGAISRLDEKGEDGIPVLRDLGSLLLQSKAEDLAGKRSRLVDLAGQGQLGLTRQIGWAGVLSGDRSVDRAWPDATAEQRANLIWAIPMVRDPAVRAGAYSKLEPLVEHSGDPEERRAAIAAISSVPGHDVEVFRKLATLLDSGVERAVTIGSLQQIPKKSWPKELAEPIAERLVSELEKSPVSERTEPDYLNAIQFASELAALLGTDKSRALAKALRGLGIPVIVVHAIYEQMLFDKQLIVVEAGKPVELILENNDAMPHNLAVIVPGAVEEIGLAAEKMPPQADAQGRTYVPDSPKVLQSTPLVQPGEKAKLSFTAPSEPGDYPFLCTFPGHWRRMVGNMAVVKDVDAYLASHAAAPEPKMTEWKLADLKGELEKVKFGRNLGNGKELFSKLACAQCHKLGTEGYLYGPELTDVLQRWKGDSASVLEQILEPSKVINDRYRNYQFELANGDSVLGMIVKEDAQALTVQTGPSDALMQTVKKSEIKERQPQPSSVMPVGLLNSLSKEQILDLLAYIEAGGKTEPAAHHH